MQPCMHLFDRFIQQSAVFLEFHVGKTLINMGLACCGGDGDAVGFEKLLGVRRGECLSAATC
jgi:hypothetical protein